MTITRNDRITGTVLGSAAADALGVHYELGIPSNGDAQMLGGGYGFEPGEWSDDTQQAYCVLAGRSDPQQVAIRLLSWYDGNPPDVGPTTGRTMAAVRRALGRHQPREHVADVMWEASKRMNAGRPAGSLSNGSLMRAAPLALPLLGRPKDIAVTARQVSDLTHYDDLTGDAVVIWSLLIDAAIEWGEQFEVHRATYRAITMIPAERQADWYELVKGPLTTYKNPAQGRGWQPPRHNLNVLKAFQAALWAVAHNDTYEATIQAAIAIGGDTDTVAAIAGGLAGAMYGASAIPQGWLSVLHGWPSLKADDLAHLALQAVHGSSGEYGEFGTDDPDEGQS